MTIQSPRVLLANEAGSGRGHVVKLRAIATALGQELPVIAAVARSRHTDELAEVGAEILRAPLMDYTAAARDNPMLEGNATWGDYLAAMGLAREDVVARGLDYWRRTIVDHDISILVTDFAPLAMRAAQGLQADGWDIQIISTGTGYGVPPATLDRFPVLLPDFARVTRPEADVLAVMNRVGAERGLDPLPTLPALYAADLPLPATFAFLDAYDGQRTGHGLCPPMVDVAPAPGPGGDEVFIYFSTRELSEPDVVAALCDLPYPRRAYLPNALPEMADRLAAAGIIIETKPLSAAAIAARSRIVLHAAQHGIICLAGLAGLPQVGLPQHLEQFFHGTRAAARGVLQQLRKPDRSKAAVLDLVAGAYDDAAMAKAARDLAAELRPQMPKDPKADLVARLAPVIDRARQALK